MLDPGWPAAAIRADEIGESTASLASGIRLSVARLAELSDLPAVAIETRLCDVLPTWRMLIFDGTTYLSAFAANSEGHRSGMYKLTAATDGVLHAGFLRQFADMWRQAKPASASAPRDRGRTEGAGA